MEAKELYNVCEGKKNSRKEIFESVQGKRNWWRLGLLLFLKRNLNWLIIIYIIKFFIIIKIKIHFFFNLSQKISCFEILKPYLKPFISLKVFEILSIPFLIFNNSSVNNYL